METNNGHYRNKGKQEQTTGTLHSEKGNNWSWMQFEIKATEHRTHKMQRKSWQLNVKCSN